MKFELIESYRRQSDEFNAKQEERARQRASALETVQALRAEYAKVMRDSLVNGTDAGKQLDKLSDQIAEAERTFERKKREYEVAETMRMHTITPQQVQDSWNQEFTPQYRSEVFNPAIEALLNAKLAYIEAYKSYRAVVKDFDDQKKDTYETLAPGRWPNPYQYKLNEIDFNLTTETDRYFIKRYDLNDLNGDKPVRSVQGLK
ncbi:hypothetical protein [Paenibacillus sp. 453mf]|uniref:hypothetical protein n=1 Tax=Paenibacillus sp. 453mf TaxID=1761874 RepID=UPI0008DF9805|nr:hypothetical protein [Paenibacillus sp. 453mf]SFS76279.1 hypothetical protein SAMN04488601_10353 [Paenibacillus sp. 453mf]